MGILNLTPDSFYAASRSQTEADVRRRARQIVDEGGSIIDVGACSTRPGSTAATEEEETERLRQGLTWVRREVPDAVLSVDTFRASVAKMCVEEFGAAIVNDVSGGEADPEMYPTVAQLGAPYVLTFPRANGIHTYLAERVQQLRDLGQKDIVLDPGFGFAKTFDQNHELLHRLPQLIARFPQLPMLVALSNKSMITKRLSLLNLPSGKDSPLPDSELGTLALNTLAIRDGASLLRVHTPRLSRLAIQLLFPHS
jgi:dihydropteroate synthase